MKRTDKTISVASLSDMNIKAQCEDTYMISYKAIETYKHFKTTEDKMMINPRILL